MTFAERIKRNRRNATIAAIVGIAATAGASGVLVFFVIFVAVPLDLGGKQIVAVLTALVSLIGYAWGWNARSTYIENVDTTVQRMGPLQRKALIAAIQEEKDE